MEYNKSKKEIRIDKELNELDKFVIEFLEISRKFTDYVIVSGYVSILLGRSRASEDIDLLIPKINKESFTNLWEALQLNSFECLNTSNINEAFKMLDEHAIRFAKELPIPNIEFKTIKTDFDKYSFDNKLKVILKTDVLFISPLEAQIAYKLFLGSEKDLEDAKHLYEVFKEKLNKDELFKFINRFNVYEKFALMEEYGNKYKFRTR